MNIKWTTLIICFLIIIGANAQEKKASFQIAKGEAIIKVQAVPGKGFVVKTGKNGKYAGNSKKVNWHLRYFDLNLKLVWDKALAKEMIGYDNDKILANINGSKIYHVEKISYNNGNFIKQIALDGAEKKQIISKSKWKALATGNFKGQFANDSSICYLFTKNGDELHNKKKLEEKLFLYQINFGAPSGKKISLKLPKIKTDPKETDFWSYAEHDNDNIYFVTYFTDESEKRTSDAAVNIARTNYNGQLLKDINILIKRDNIAKINQIGTKIDMENEHIYVYGLEQLRLNVKENDQRNLFIIQYDFDGNLLWENKIEGISAGNGYFSIDVLIQGNKDPHLELKARNLRATWEFTPAGKSIKAYTTNLTEVVRIKGNFIPNEGSSNYEYFKNCRSREHMYYSTNVTKAKDKGVLIEHNDETGQVDVLLFVK